MRLLFRYVRFCSVLFFSFTFFPLPSKWQRCGDPPFAWYDIVCARLDGRVDVDDTIVYWWSFRAIDNSEVQIVLDLDQSGWL